ncbi:hypothetical protein B0H21DRAFT_818986 [Amylocystis lapponica]|nr:hypothetical protein B0H21DRAFT_818986 [Amylocystis lapponica]
MSPRKRRTNSSSKNASPKKTSPEKTSPKKATRKPVSLRPVVVIPARINKRKTHASKVAPSASVSSVHSVVELTGDDSRQPSPAPVAPAPAPLGAEESLWIQVRREMEEEEAEERRRAAAQAESQAIFRVQVAKMMQSKLWVDAHMNAADEAGAFDSSRSCSSVDGSRSGSVTERGDSPASDHEHTRQPEFVEGSSRRQTTPQPQFVEGSSRGVPHPPPGFTLRRCARHYTL